jgi:hypothetical protein
MARPRIKHYDLPPRMVRRLWRDRRGRVHQAYYYQHPKDQSGSRKVTALGTDLVRAKIEWAKLEAANFHCRRASYR